MFQNDVNITIVALGNWALAFLPVATGKNIILQSRFAGGGGLLKRFSPKKGHFSITLV